MRYCDGATWVAIKRQFGRVASLDGTRRRPRRSPETPYDLNFPRGLTAIEMAHARGLSVMLVPHLWVESGEWRALIDPATDAGWARWAASYTSFVLGWARVAEAEHAEMFSAGVELRSWVTTDRAPSFEEVIKAIRREYHGRVTYSANWDDVDRTVILGDLDVIGINAFYPLADHDGARATPEAPPEGGDSVRAKNWACAVRMRGTGRYTLSTPGNWLHDATPTIRRPSVGVARRDARREGRRSAQ